MYLNFFLCLTFSMTDTKAFNKHVENHNSAQTYKCALCNYTAGNVEYVKTHMQKHSKPSGYFYCDQCPFSTRSTRLLQEHLLRHIGIARWSCDQCNFSASSENKARRHIVSKHDSIGTARERKLIVKFNMDVFQQPKELQEQWLIDNDLQFEPKYVITDLSDSSEIQKLVTQEGVDSIPLGDGGGTIYVESTAVESEDYIAEDQLIEQDIYACAVCSHTEETLEKMTEHINEQHSKEGNEVETKSDSNSSDLRIVEVTEVTVPELLTFEGDFEVGQQVAVTSEPTDEMKVVTLPSDMQDEAISTAVESILNLQEVTVPQNS